MPDVERCALAAHPRADAGLAQIHAHTRQDAERLAKTEVAHGVVLAPRLCAAIGMAQPRAWHLPALRLTPRPESPPRNSISGPNGWASSLIEAEQVSKSPQLVLDLADRRILCLESLVRG